jgi:hypothetical protein
MFLDALPHLLDAEVEFMLRLLLGFTLLLQRDKVVRVVG